MQTDKNEPLEFIHCDPDTLDRFRAAIRRHLDRRNSQTTINIREAAMNSFNVYLQGRKIETVWSPETDAYKVRENLIAQGSNPNITVQKETHVTRRYPR